MKNVYLAFLISNSLCSIAGLTVWAVTASDLALGFAGCAVANFAAAVIGFIGS